MGDGGIGLSSPSVAASAGAVLAAGAAEQQLPQLSQPVSQQPTSQQLFLWCLANSAFSRPPCFFFEQHDVAQQLSQQDDASQQVGSQQLLPQQDDASQQVGSQQLSQPQQDDASQQVGSQQLSQPQPESQQPVSQQLFLCFFIMAESLASNGCFGLQHELAQHEAGSQQLGSQQDDASQQVGSQQLLPQQESASQQVGSQQLSQPQHESASQQVGSQHGSASQQVGSQQDVSQQLAAHPQPFSPNTRSSSPPARL